jgi:hypothetical protein
LYELFPLEATSGSKLTLRAGNLLATGFATVRLHGKTSGFSIEIPVEVNELLFSAEFLIPTLPLNAELSEEYVYVSFALNGQQFVEETSAMPANFAAAVAAAAQAQQAPSSPTAKGGKGASASTAASGAPASALAAAAAATSEHLDSIFLRFLYKRPPPTAASAEEGTR